MAKRVLVEQGSKYNDVLVFDTGTGDYVQYTTAAKSGFPFDAKYHSNYKNAGYNSLDDMISLLKKRFKGKIVEVDYKVQRESERIGYLKLGVERIRRNISIDKRISCDCFSDICEKLGSYGMSYVDAQKQIIELYKHDAR